MNHLYSRYILVERQLLVVNVPKMVMGPGLARFWNRDLPGERYWRRGLIETAQLHVVRLYRNKVEFHRILKPATSPYLSKNKVPKVSLFQKHRTIPIKIMFDKSRQKPINYSVQSRARHRFPWKTLDTKQIFFLACQAHSLST